MYIYIYISYPPVGSPIASKAPESLGIFALSVTIQNSTRARKVDQLLCRITIPRKTRGQNTVHKQ